MDKKPEKLSLYRKYDKKMTDISKPESRLAVGYFVNRIKKIG